MDSSNPTSPRIGFGYDRFLISELGQQIAALVSSPEVISEIKGWCRDGYPAVQPVALKLRALAIAIDDPEMRKHVGRLVGAVLEREGWTGFRTSRVSPGLGWRTGQIYRPKRKPRRAAPVHVLANPPVTEA